MYWDPVFARLFGLAIIRSVCLWIHIDTYRSGHSPTRRLDPCSLAILFQGCRQSVYIGDGDSDPRFPILTHCGTRISSPLYTKVSNPYILWDKDFQSCTLATPRFQFHVESVARIQASPHVRALAILLLEFRPVHEHVHWKFCC